MTTRFRDRTDAGRQLAPLLKNYANRLDAIVLGLPRGGVPVAYEVAQALQLPLNICVVRKLGVPDNRELAMGAITAGGVRVLNDAVIRELSISEQSLEQITSAELKEVQRRDQLYRMSGDVSSSQQFSGPTILDRTLILVDDGLATGATMRAAIEVLRSQRPKDIVVAVPVAPRLAYEELQNEVDEVVCVTIPSSFRAIGQWYEDFTQTKDEEVRNLLAKSFTLMHR